MCVCVCVCVCDIIPMFCLDIVTVLSIVHIIFYFIIICIILARECDVFYCYSHEKGTVNVIRLKYWQFERVTLRGQLSTAVDQARL